MKTLWWPQKKCQEREEQPGKIKEWEEKELKNKKKPFLVFFMSSLAQSNPFCMNWGVFKKSSLGQSVMMTVCPWLTLLFVKKSESKFFYFCEQHSNQKRVKNIFFTLFLINSPKKRLERYFPILLKAPDHYPLDNNKLTGK